MKYNIEQIIRKNNKAIGIIISKEFDTGDKVVKTIDLTDIKISPEIGTAIFLINAINTM
jgi:protein associated with RNAse G/E